MRALQSVNPERAAMLRSDNADIFKRLETGESEIDDDVEAGEFLNEDLLNALNESCPDYCYFGAHPGDGSDYGVWPSFESLEEAVSDGEVLKCANLSDVPEDWIGSVMLVNDHGNVSLYSVDGKNTKEIWSVV
jgi:hypothetical protein